MLLSKYMYTVHLLAATCIYSGPFNRSTCKPHYNHMQCSNNICIHECDFTCSTNFWSMCLFAIVGWKSGDSRKRRKNSYTICKWGHELSKFGSSSSGSYSAPEGFVEGGSDRKAFWANCGQENRASTHVHTEKQNKTNYNVWWPQLPPTHNHLQKKCSLFLLPSGQLVHVHESPKVSVRCPPEVIIPNYSTLQTSNKQTWTAGELSHIKHAGRQSDMHMYVYYMYVSRKRWSCTHQRPKRQKVSIKFQTPESPNMATKLHTWA